nr:hypothetical protein [Thermostichus lividus]
MLPPLRPDPLPFPLAFWYEPQSFAVLDHQSDRLYLAASAAADLAALQKQLEALPPPPKFRFPIEQDLWNWLLAGNPKPIRRRWVRS